MNLAKLKQRPAVFHRLFGVSPAQFDQLVADVGPTFARAESARLRKKRKIRKGSGRRFKLSLEEAVAMLLLYVRSYATHIFLAEMFGINDGNVCRYFAKVRRPVESVFDLPERDLDLTESAIAGLVVDATEQRTERRDKGTGYSGKKKAYTVKTQLVVDRKAKIRHVSLSVPGSVHDKRLFDRSKVVLPPNARGDLGYLGAGIRIPLKASKLHPLTDAQKERNVRFSRARIVVEHVLASIKQFRILADRFRGALTHYHEYFLIACGLRELARS